MPSRPLRAVRYARAWLAGPVPLVEEELELDRDGRPVPATLFRPRPRSGRGERLAGWIVLHGMTRTGRAHAQLARFTRALASTGAAAIIPEVPEWRALRMAPHLAAPTVRAAAAGLRGSGAVRDEPFGVVGFSFGAPHAVAASGHDAVRGEVGGSIAFGGYCDLERTVRFMMTGRHEWAGRTHHLRPDPYGRWIVASNYLTAVPAHEDASDVQDAVRRLAARVGEDTVPSWDPRYDPLKEELRRGVAEERRPLFDLLAPPALDLLALPSPSKHALERGLDLADEIAAAARRTDPAVEPSHTLGCVEAPAHVLHGRQDHLIPFSEGLRLYDALPAPARAGVTVTRLFGHSGQDPLPSLVRQLGEVPRLFRALGAALGVV